MGVADVHLPHVADAMVIFNEAWSKLLLSTVLKCWSKSKCRPMLQVGQAREQTGQSSTGSEESFATPVLSQEVSEEIYSDICALNYQTQVENPLSEIMPPYTGIRNASEISEALNSFSVTGKDVNRHDIAAKEVQKMFDNSRVPEVDNHPPNANDAENEQNSSVSVLYICKNIINFLRDKPDLNENEDLKQKMNSILLNFLNNFALMKQYPLSAPS